MSQEINARRGRIPDREKRIFKLEEGVFEGRATLDLKLYVDRRLAQSWPVLSLNDEVKRAWEVRDLELCTLMNRHSRLSFLAMWRMLAAVLLDELARTAHCALCEPPE